MKQCDEISKLIHERAKIEQEYAHRLKSFSKSWGDRVEKGPEYGTIAAAWRAILEEAESVADVHVKIRDDLINDVQNNVHQWKKENYKKPALGPCKETKQLEDEFRKAQKPWAKRLSKVNKTKKDYHTACKNEKSAANQENNARADSGLSPDALKKMQEKSEKCRKDVEVTREKYNQALDDLNGYNAVYMENMIGVFQQAQEMESRRLTFFKEMFYGVHKCLDISHSPTMDGIYIRCSDSIDQADHGKDLKWWAMNHGSEMPMNWPAFEEYAPDLHTIHRKEKKTNNDAVMGKSIKTKDTSSDVPTPKILPPTEPVEERNPFGEDDWEEQDGEELSNPTVDHGEEGKPVRALYDYEGTEEDELTFHAGDVFEKLRDRDEQGWCKGRKDGRVGLYPDNYVEVIG